MTIRRDASIAVGPAIVAAYALLAFCLRPLLKHRPQWAKNFAAETEHPPGRGKRWTHWTAILLFFSSAGLGIAIASTISPPRVPSNLLSILPWAVTVLIAAVDRPRSTPKILLVIIFAQLLCLVFLLLSCDRIPGLAGALAIAEACVALAVVLVILLMPMRDPNLDRADISSPSKPPSFHLRSPEDNLSLWQFMSVSWMSTLISTGSKKQLNDEDVWKLPHEFQHAKLHLLFRDLKGTVVKRLLKANGLDLIITSFCGILESVTNLFAPVILQRLLRSIEDGQSSRRTAIEFAAFILAIRLVAAQSAVFSLWYSRRCYERSRGEMITMIYEKTLTRKSFGSQAEEKVVEEDSADTAEGPPPPKSRLARLYLRLSHVFRWRKDQSQTTALHDAKQPATMGKILNLMRNDVYEVAQRFWEFPSIITKPLAFVVSFVLIWKLLGWPCLPGMACVIIAQIVNASLVRFLLQWERTRRTATDKRLQTTSQFVEAIRHLRWYDWQNHWLDKIMDARRHELRLRLVTGFLNIAISATNTMANGIFPVAVFYAYTLLAGQPLSIDVAFPALQLFNQFSRSLRELPGLITVLLNASVAVGRIEDFMSEPDKEEKYVHTESFEIAFHNAAFSWPGKTVPVLEKLNLRFPVGLTVICGKVGTGKTALLEAALGELDRVAGEASLPDEMVGYCTQSPWLQHMSIRENILFTSPYDERRYKQVLEACALTPDLSNFKNGDLSHIGENGIGLSGGQKARVALARAVYSRARLLLLDDPLAALDHNTAETIVSRLLRGPLMENRTVLLVTHRVDLCSHLADQMVEIRGGTAHLLDPSALPSEYLSSKDQEDADSNEPDSAEVQLEQEENAVPDKFIEDEHRAHGGVVASVYWQYIKAGKLKWWAIVILLFALFRLNRLMNYWFLKSWGEAYGRVREQAILNFSNLFDGLPSPETNVRPWLVGYLSFALTQVLLDILSESVLLAIVYTAGKRLYKQVLLRVSCATFRFYDVTPVGRLMNRLTSDMGTLDGGISQQLQDVVWWVIAWVSSIVVIASVTPLFLAFSLGLTAWFVFIFFRFLPTSQSLRRLEMVSLTPLMSNFGILLDGLITIRAFRAQPHFQDRVIVVTDAFQKMDHFYWSLQAWLMYRYDALSACSTFALTLIALYQNLSSGLTAFMLTAASTLVLSTHSLCKEYGKLQMDFVSVERVIELLHLEEEPSGNEKPPASWPAYGDDIEFDNVTIRYAAHLEPSLENISLRIPGGSTTAIVGRTGSGKSTLALTLLATVLPEAGGCIRVGNIDLANVDVHAWRQRISFVAQDPVLFPGTLRQNLDPLHEHSDAACLAVLHRVLGAHWALETAIDGGGRNLSQGQRQLVGLGRAVMRRSPVVVLDEATASIDRETALWIQDVLREELRESTVLTIAHRVEAVKDAQFVVVLEGGRVKAAGRVGDVRF
ncbi:uncharacterized protein K452DRAFT_267620, partial [Aplosporella prunicola CBS 121167]